MSGEFVDSDDRIDLASRLTKAEMIALADDYGGTRLYIPSRMSREHRLARSIGFNSALTLSREMAGTYVRIPLLREARAIHHRSAGRSYAWIARRLGMTETGVEMLLRRAANREGGTPQPNARDDSGYRPAG